ncbi:MAG TPA: ABC transporter permease [Methanotrichaceae archaeon]|mgnify:CR=1 FL=1|nr:ABC transporter permease [Methanotrichaceae archaeon]HQF15743.1 ABC transporter permease [Methanotrichaceae archaeon]HQI90584.1 ABC transporter permease [Methanotrichaceae archaeon]
MLRYAARRLVLIVPTLLGISILTFMLLHLIPGDPAEILLRQQGVTTTPEALDRLRAAMGLQDPLHLQYLHWLNSALHGDLGRSLAVSYGRPVLPEILRRLGATLELATASLAFSILISLPLGVLSALRRGSFFDILLVIGSSLGTAVPAFWLGPILMLLFSLYLGWLPVCGRGGLEHLVLPALTLGIGAASLTSRVVQASMTESLNEDCIMAARAKGLPEVHIVLRHSLRNALLPLVTISGLQFGWLLEGAVFAEVIFTWPGLGKLLVDSISSRDIPMVQGCVLLISLVFVLVNLVVDILYCLLDPRVRYD